MLRSVMTAAATSAMGLALLAAPAVAQAPAAPAAPAVNNQSPATAPAGSYNLDARHASVVARVQHQRASRSVFRFDTVSGTLNWNPAQPTQSSVSVKIDPKSITSNVAGFGAELGGDRFLNAARYPDATFQSTRVEVTGPNRGRVHGNLTLMGQTKPVVIDAEFTGANRNPQGKALIGFSGTTKFKRSDFGFNALQGPIGDEVELIIDLEFIQA